MGMFSKNSQDIQAVPGDKVAQNVVMLQLYFPNCRKIFTGGS